QEELGRITAEISQIKAEIGKEKADLVEVKDPEVEQAREQLSDKIYGQYRAQIAELVRQSAALEEVQKTELMETLLAEFGTELDEAEAKPVLPVDEKLLGKIVDELMKKEARRMILEDGI